MASELCEACQSITLSMLVDGFQHPLNHDQVLASADHCRLCDILRVAYASQSCIQHDRRQACDTDHGGPLLWRLETSGPGARWGMFKLDSYHYGDTFRISVPEESSVFRDRVITHRDIQVSNSPRNIRLLREWLSECRLEHDECRRGTYSGTIYDEQTVSTTLPYRVIDVGSDDDEKAVARLFTTHNVVGRYLTLSHCWGRVIPPRLTKATLDAWHHQLPMDDMPKTFRDAIWLTRELGERYLWIDSLCIVQDDPDDLNTQIGLMGAIFEETFCTIAAVDAKGSDGSQDADAGLFLSGPEHLRIATLLVRTTDSDADNVNETPCEVRIQEAPKPAYPFPLRLEGKAWYSRGWVFQERELSRRCIFFTHEDLGWRCNRYWETEQTGIPERRWHRGDYSLEDTTSYGGVSYDTEFNLRKTWQNAVNKYSVTRLTFASDKHRALMGFEERLHTRCGYVFRHGIIDFGRSDHLHVQLLWIPVVSRGQRSVVTCPSWSWMSVQAAVTWAHSEYLVYPELMAEVEFAQESSDESQAIRVTGPCQSIRIGMRIGDIPHHNEFDRWPPETHFGWSELDLHADTNTLLSDNGEVTGWVILDTSDEFEAEALLAIPLLRYLRQDDEQEPMCVDFLAVSRNMTHSSTSTDSETHRRVGRGRVLKGALDWVDGCQSSSFTVL